MKNRLHDNEVKRPAPGTIAEGRASAFRKARDRSGPDKPAADMAMRQLLDPEERERLDANLLEAAKKGDSAHVQELVAEGADPNARGRNGMTPLMEAVFWGRRQVVGFLVENDADVNARHRNGWTPLMWCAIEGDEKIASVLIGRGANVNAMDRSGGNALRKAVTHWSRDVARLLLTAQADVNAEDRNGTTALKSITTGFMDSVRMEIAKMLREHGARE